MANVASTITLNVNSTQVNTATAEITAMGMASRAASGLVTGLALGLAGISVGALVAGVKSTLEFGDALAETSAKLGVTVEQLQHLQGAGIQLNSGVNGMTSAFTKFQEVLGSAELGNQKAQKSIGLLGDEVKNSIKTHESAYDTFLKAVTAVSQYTDVNQRAAAANKLFGDSGTDIVTGLTAAGVTMTEFMAQQEKEAVLSAADAAEASKLNDQFDALSRTIGNQMKSALLGFISNLDGVDSSLEHTSGLLNSFLRNLSEGLRITAIAVGLASKTAKEQYEDSTNSVLEANKKLVIAERELTVAINSKNDRGIAASKKRVEDLQSEINASDKLMSTYEINAHKQKAMDEASEKFKKASSAPVGAGTLAPTHPSSGGGLSASHAIENAHKQEQKAYDDSLKAYRAYVLENEKVDASLTTDKIKQIDLRVKADIAKEREVLNNFKATTEVKAQMAQAVDVRITQIEAKGELDRRKVREDEQKSKLSSISSFESNVLSLMKGGAEQQQSMVRAVAQKERADIKAKYEDIIKQEKLTNAEIISLRRGLAVALEGINAKEVVDSQKAETERLKNSKDIVDQLSANWNDNTTLMGAAMQKFTTSAASAFVDFAMTGKSSFGDMALSIVSDIAKMIIQLEIQMAIEYALKALRSGFSTGGVFGTSGGGAGSSTDAGMKGDFGTFATGGAFNSGIQYFADGDVVDKPTGINLAGGRKGVMGEAGPEAIMPLSRGSDGKLGVKGGGSSVQDNSISVGAIHVTLEQKDNETSDEQAVRFAKAARLQLEALIDKKIANSTRSGNTLRPIQVQNSF